MENPYRTGYNLYEEPRRNKSNRLLVLALILDLVLAGAVGYLYVDRGRLQSTINGLVVSQQTLSNELNMTRTQMQYYQNQAEYYSRLIERGNASQGFVGKATINIVAVRSLRRGFSVIHEGITMTAEIEAEIGEGRILVNTEPRVGIDVQTSVRTAIEVAEKVTGIKLGMTDVILTILAEEENEIIDGSSAGGCITVALLAAIQGDDLNDTVYMTGTIESDGSIGQIGGVVEKGAAAAEKGATLFLVPEGQGTLIIREKKESHPFPGMTIITYEPKEVDLQKYLHENGYEMKVLEVQTVEDAYTHFVG